MQITGKNSVSESASFLLLYSFRQQRYISSLRFPYLIETSSSYKTTHPGYRVTSQCDICCSAECRYKYVIQARPARPLVVTALRSFPRIGWRTRYVFARSPNQRGCGDNYAVRYILVLNRDEFPP
jgi:hypothetical protein